MILRAEIAQLHDERAQLVTQLQRAELAEFTAPLDKILRCINLSGSATRKQIVDWSGFLRQMPYWSPW